MSNRIKILGLGVAFIAMVGCKKDSATTTTTAASVSAPAAPASTPAAKAELPPLDDKLPPEELAKAMVPRFVSYDVGPASDEFKGLSLKAPPDAKVEDWPGFSPTVKVSGSEKDFDKFVAANVLIVKENVDFAAFKTKLQTEAKKSSIKVDIVFVTDTADVVEWKQVSPSITNYGYAKHLPGGKYTCQTDGAGGSASAIIARGICDSVTGTK